MTTPAAAGPDVAVALDALEADARRWTDAAAVLRDAAAAAAGQVLAPGVFSFAGGEVAAAYEALRGRTARLLAEGADNLDAVATALRASAAAYAADEAAGGAPVGRGGAGAAVTAAHHRSAAGGVAR